MIIKNNTTVLKATLFSQVPSMATILPSNNTQQFYIHNYPLEFNIPF